MSLRAKRSELKAGWDADALDIAFAHGEAIPKADGAMLFHALANKVLFRGEGRTLLQELERRGYDLTTLAFSIEKTQEAA